MADPKGDKLFVNLGASQTRRRLKGFGHGVRKVQAAGRNQAVIIHTATAQHLRELEALFADVGFSSSPSDLSQPVDNLKNIGPATAAWLREAGIHTIGELERIGPVAAYRMITSLHPQANVNLLWALAAGLGDRDWRTLPAATRQRLQAEADSL